MVYSDVTVGGDEIDYELIEAFQKGLMPTPLLTVSEWADTHRYLSSEASAEHGKWRTERTPYLRKPMDCASPTSTYSEIYCIKASQQGFTEFMLNVLATFMDIAPCPAMYIMPTVNMAKSFSKQRVTPMIDACPNLNTKIKPARERDANNTVLEKSFPGGVSIFTGANSAAELSSRPIRVLFGDEIDRYPIDVDGEGSPWELAKKRTITFSNRKVIGISTPTIKGVSFIERLVEDTDQQKYHVQLPCCEGTKQPLEFEQLRYTVGDYDSTKYECIHCGAEVDERYKAKFLPELGYGGTAEWIATVPTKSSKTKIGFVINGLYSPLGLGMSWAQITEEYEKVKDNVVLLRTFWNTVLGRSFAEKTDTPPWENLYNRRETYGIGTVSKDVVFITMGIDVQGDRLEMEVVGWCEGKESYSVEYVVLYGDTAGAEVWNKLAAQIDKVYYKEDGTGVPIRMTAIDTGFNTTHVYTFCRRFDPNRVIPIKGDGKQQTVVRRPSTIDVKTKSGKKTGTIKLWYLGVSVIKSEIYGWLRQEKIEGTPPGYMHFPEYDVEYFKGLTAEALTLKVVNGYNTYVWENVYGRNEPLDCRAYARGAACVIGMDRLTAQQWNSLRVALSKSTIRKAELSTTPVVKKKKVKRNDDFWNK